VRINLGEQLRWLSRRCRRESGLQQDWARNRMGASRGKTTLGGDIDRSGLKFDI